MVQTRISQDNPAILAKRLAEMPASQVAQEMEQALGTMTPETYDAAIIDAYLDELERKAPMPEFPEEKTAWDAFTGDAACPKPAAVEAPVPLFSSISLPPSTAPLPSRRMPATPRFIKPTV